jgi:hypothetical protein
MVNRKSIILYLKMNFADVNWNRLSTEDLVEVYRVLVLVYEAPATFMKSR